jgi:glycosyltransferase involved in cell wall biosynthesis
VALQQRVVPDYRALFFDHLARACEAGLTVFAGGPRTDEGVVAATSLEVAQLVPARNVHLLSGAWYVCWQPGIVAWLEREHPDALILEANARYPGNMAAAAWARRRGLPVLGWGLGAPPLRGVLSAVRRAARAVFLRRFDFLIAYSRRGAEEYRHAGLADERIIVAPNAVLPAPGALRRRSPRAGRAPRVLFVGRLQARKRLDLLLKACAEALPTPELWVAGDGPARATLETLASEVYPTARFVGDQRGPALDALLDQADLFVLPGTGGLAVQQAMAHGLPIIVAEGDGTQEDMVSVENGWLVPAGDQDSLSAALRDALNAPEERLRAMGLASHRMALERFNIAAMTEAFVEALRRASGGRRG